MMYRSAAHVNKSKNNVIVGKGDVNRDMFTFTGCRHNRLAEKGKKTLDEHAKRHSKTFS